MIELAGWIAAGLCAFYVWYGRRRYARSLRDRGHLLDEAAGTAARIAIAAERARIARELHDVVSHNVSLMVIQAGAARHAMSGAPESATEALQEVESSGREAMTELRHLLGVLAPDEEGLDLAPQPSLSKVSQLADRIAFAGLPVELTVDGVVRPLPPGVDLTAYRIVQEALINALKHAPGARAEVMMRYTDKYLRLEIVNTGPSVLTGQPAPLPVTTSGRGLIGLRERVAVYGGDLDARRRLGGGYRVRARIPL